MAKRKPRPTLGDLDRKLGHAEASRVMMQDSLRLTRATTAAMPEILVRLARSAAAVARSVQRLRH